MNSSQEPAEPRPNRRQAAGGFTLIELMIVTVIIALLAAISVPQFDKVRQRAYNAAALADLHNAMDEIERYYNENFRYPANENELYAAGYAHTPGVSFMAFYLRDAGNPDLARVHMHIAHEGSLNYYHYEYPEGYAGTPEIRWK